MAVTEETEAQVRELREKAEEYGARVAAGEEPWKEDPDWEEPEDNGQELPDVKNDYVGEDGVEVTLAPETYPDGEEDDGA